MKPHEVSKNRTKNPMHSGVAASSQDGSKRGKIGAGMNSSRNADHKARGSNEAAHRSTQSGGKGY